MGDVFSCGPGQSNKSNCPGSNTQLGPHTRLHEVLEPIIYMMVLTTVASALKNNQHPTFSSDLSHQPLAPRATTLS